MIVKYFSYRFAAEILQHPKYSMIFSELMRVCTECPLPLYEGKSRTQAGKDIVQQVMNSFFKHRFVSLGWEAEPLATPNDNEDALRSDFRKTFCDATTGEITATIQIEVEFGNVASSYRNYFKFQLSFSYGLTDICVLIVPSQHLSVRIDSGVSNFEKTLREIPSAKLSITVPTLVIGLFDEDENGRVVPWDVKAITTNLDVLKGDKLADRPQHSQIIQTYVNQVSTIPVINQYDPLGGNALPQMNVFNARPDQNLMFPEFFNQ
jgi:hypothetical protein